jgi:hypothetical protein
MRRMPRPAIQQAIDPHNVLANARGRLIAQRQD